MSFFASFILKCSHTSLICNVAQASFSLYLLLSVDNTYKETDLLFPSSITFSHSAVSLIVNQLLQFDR